MDTHISALIASRICHDLISPIGAVLNGLELLELSGAPRSGEMELVNDSARNATARIRYFRLAFGTATADQSVSAEELSTLLALIFSTGRITIKCHASGQIPRPEAKALLLAIMCAERACPGRGEITVAQLGKTWRITAQADQISPEPELWAALTGEQLQTDVPPAAVQFILLPQAIADIDRRINVQTTDTQMEMAF